MAGDVFEVGRALLTAMFGVFLLAGAMQGWYLGGRAHVLIRIALGIGALAMIEGGIVSDLIGVAVAGAAAAAKRVLPEPKAAGA